MNGAAHSAILVFLFEAAVDGTGIARLGYVIEGHEASRDAAEFGTVEIGGQGKEPRGESGLAAPVRERAVGAEEGLLGHFLGATAIVAEAIGEVHQGALPASDESFKC